MMSGSQDVLREYSDSIKVIRRQCLEAGLSEEEFRDLYFESLHSIQADNNNTALPRPMLSTRSKVILCIGLPSAIIFINYRTVYYNIVSNLQDYIYPTLRIVRKLFIPFLSLFPSLSEYYHDTCLVQNPFFTVVDIDCWPCSSINNVRELHNPTESISSQNHAPFVYETEQPVIDVYKLRDIYLKNNVTFDKESPKVNINSGKYYITAKELFNKPQFSENLYIWTFNSMPAVRTLRQSIPRPKVVPKFGQSTERFIIIDLMREKFKVPDTECSFSFLLSLSGSRNIVLEPSEECKHQCRSLNVDLKDSYLLWYNWWYWRPVIQSTTSNVTFIANVGSYC